MKILFFIHSLDSGGAERVLSILANDWKERHHDVTIVINSEQNLFYSINPSIKIKIAKVHSSGLKANIARIKSYKRIIQKEEPDIVISFMTTMNILTTIAAKLEKKPIIISERITYSALESGLWGVLRRLTYPFADLLMVQTHFEKTQYPFLSNIETIENPLFIQKKHQNIQREKIILAIGRLVYNKGFDMLIDAFDKLENKQGWKLIILGEGEERTALEKQIEALNLADHIFLLGRISDTEQHYKKSSLFILSSRIEGFPNVLCEAMAYGCPPIAFDCLTGPSDIIRNNENGLLIEAENVTKLSQAIQELINSKQKRERISTKAKEISNRLSIDKITNRWFTSINKLIDKNKR